MTKRKVERDNQTKVAMRKTKVTMMRFLPPLVFSPSSSDRSSSRLINTKRAGPLQETSVRPLQEPRLFDQGEYPSCICEMSCYFHPRGPTVYDIVLLSALVARWIFTRRSFLLHSSCFFRASFSPFPAILTVAFFAFYRRSVHLPMDDCAAEYQRYVVG
eukprot:8873874-Pyramimonas_sp.AAC.1